MRPTVATRYALLLALLATGCADDAVGPGDGLEFETSFESGFDGFVVDGTDLDDPPVVWDIALTTELSFDGDQAVRFTLDNLNDAGKIWIERPFELDPDRAYDVELSYAFASADFGDINLWTVIAGVVSGDPETVDDLPFEGSTANGHDEDEGFVWLELLTRQTVTTGPSGEVWLALGVWGTSEFPRTYYLDDLRVTFIPR